MDIFKIVKMSQMEDYGFDLNELPFILLGSGKFITLEYDSEDQTWFPMPGANRFKTVYEAKIAIEDRMHLNWVLAK